VPDNFAKLKDDDKQVVFARIANDLEETLDLGVVYCGTKKRDSMVITLEVMEALAAAIDKPELAREIRQRNADIADKQFPKSWQTGETLTYMVPPASLRTRSDIAVREQLKALMMIIWQTLPRALRYSLRR
jgi:hypothetical protein